MRRGKHGSCRNGVRRALYVAPSQGLTGSAPFGARRVGSDASKRLHPDRAAHRGGDHRVAGDHPHPEVLQHEGEGLRRLDEVRSSEPRDGGGSLLLRQHEVHDQLRADEQLQSVGRRDHDRQRHDVWVVGVDHERLRAGPAMRSLLGDRGAVGASYGGGTHYLPVDPSYREFTRRREGMCFALDVGVWLHRHTLRGEPMVHLVSADKERLLALGPAFALKPAWLQYKPLQDPTTGIRVPAWHWDVMRVRLMRLDAGPATTRR